MRKVVFVSILLTSAIGCDYWTWVGENISWGLEGGVPFITPGFDVAEWIAGALSNAVPWPLLK